MSLKYYVGIDFGGTTIKGGIVDEKGTLLVKNNVPTEVDKGKDEMIKNIGTLICKLLDESGLTIDDIESIGMGIPGVIDSKLGQVVLACNLRWEKVDVASELSALIGKKVFVSNDANVAALGEVKFGAGGGRENAVMITLGTGVGSGIIANGKLIEGHKGAGAELGHAVMVMDGEQCTCGRRGCIEAYVSATALIRDTKRAMEKNPDSKLWEGVKSLDDVDAKLSFDYWEIDETAKNLVQNYIKYLGDALSSIGNIFRPEVIILGGGVSYQGKRLTDPLQEYVDNTVFAGKLLDQIVVTTAELKNDAGIFGAAALCMLG